jgi:solute carrier family 25 (adenine nucleotide translocator) protein 4/5/6/31
MASKSKENGTARRSFNEAIAGGAAGAFARTVVAPIDRIKLCSQLRGSIHTSSSTNFSPNDSGVQIFQKLVRSEGLLSLWRGNFPTICAEAGNTALNFVFFDYYKQVGDHILDSIGNSHFREDGHDGGRNRRILRSFISGGLAGATTVTFMYPLGFMRTRLACDVGADKKNERQFKNMRHITKSIWASDGFRGFYQGYGIALISVSMHRFIYLGGYDFIKSEYAARQTIQDSSGKRNKMLLAERYAAAQIVSMSASTLHYPLDCVRRRLMMQAGVPKEARKYRNAFQCFVRVWNKEGVRGFYLGLGPNLLRCVGSALALVFYDEFKRILTSLSIPVRGSIMMKLN